MPCGSERPPTAGAGPAKMLPMRAARLSSGDLVSQAKPQAAPRAMMKAMAM